MSRSGDRPMADNVTEQRREDEAAAAVGVTSKTTPSPDGERAPRRVIFDVDDISVFYGEHKAIRNVTLDLHVNEITALIGPSGCGKSTFIRCLNRMNDLIPTARVEGSVLYHGEDLYAEDVDPVEVRKLVGMVFQKPNPFPKSIYDNVAFGPRVLGMKDKLDDRVEHALR